MKFDVLGRINNMQLPDGKTAILYSVYEAVSNSIHAINDRFGEDHAQKKGKITIDIDVDADLEVEGITIIDNGIGFTPANLLSFETSDSRFKYARGGKGVGRFIWIKMFENINVESVYEENETTKQVTFHFDPEKENSIVDKTIEVVDENDPGTVVKLTGLRPEHKGRIRPTSYLKDLALHFFPQFLAGVLPDVEITYRGETSSLREFIEGRIDEPVEQKVPVELDGEPTYITVKHLFVDSNISTGLRNSYLLTAHGRLVGDPVSIERKFALNNLEDGKAYVAVVSSEFLDTRVDQERLAFRLTNDQLDAIQNAIMTAAESFLHEHIGRLRSSQRATVEELIREHPQLATQIDNIDEYVAQLGAGMDDEQIAQNLFVLLYRDERELKKKIEGLNNIESLGPELREQAESALSEVENQAKHRLAELVVKRHQILKLANLLLKYEDYEEKRYHYEKVLHDLVCPMGEMYKTGDFADHNLWILDESLSGYQFFASDKSIDTFASGSKSKKEPDIVFFNPLGFRREGTNEPVVVVEFKRPGDVRPSKDPVDQVLGYIDEMRGHTVRDLDGEVVSDIGDSTPFECIIVCELTEQTRRLLERSLAQNPSPDGEGYYGWSRAHNAHLRVISFKKMLRDAEMRNQAYFDQLSLGSPSLAAKKRAAKARKKRAEGVGKAGVAEQV